MVGLELFQIGRGTMAKKGIIYGNHRLPEKENEIVLLDELDFQVSILRFRLMFDVSVFA
jgi:hypothetical protein